MAKFILAIDQGTTSSRAILFDQLGQLRHSAQQEFEQHYPEDGWVEHQPDTLWDSVLNTCKQCLQQAGVAADEVAAIGITNQRETTLVWDRQTGQPVYNAIVWQDRRTADFCQRLKEQGHEAAIIQKTGLLVDAYFSASKLRWILDNVPGVRQRAEAGELAFGTVDTYLLWRLTEGKVHATDATNASRTQLFNIHQQQWDPQLLRLFDIPASLLPQVQDSSSDYGHCAPVHFGQPIPIGGIAGDQQAALIGQGCLQPGMAKITYGTGCFFMLNTGSTPLVSDNRLLTTLAYRLNGQPVYALEGSIFIAGAVIKWLRDQLKFYQYASESQRLAQQAAVDHGIYLVPAFTGLGAPFWDPKARGAIMGLTLDTGINELVSAALQSVCYQTRDLQHAMEKDGQKPELFRVDGGMTSNDWLLQFLADMLDARVDRPAIVETTALGAAYLAGLQVGYFSGLPQLTELWQHQRSFTPAMSSAKRESLYRGWQEAVGRVLSN